MNSPNEGDFESSATSAEIRSSSIFMWLCFTAIFATGLPALAYLQTLSLDSPKNAFHGITWLHIGYSILAACAFAFVVFLICGIYYLTCAGRRKHSILPLAGFVIVLISNELALHVAENTRAFEDRFEESRQEFESSVQTISAGTIPTLPTKIGHFQITEIEVMPNGVIVFYTKVERLEKEPGQDYEPRSWHWGFAYCPLTLPDETVATEIGLHQKMGDYHRVRRLKGSWFVFFNTNDYVNRGWS